MSSETVSNEWEVDIDGEIEITVYDYSTGAPVHAWLTRTDLEAMLEAMDEESEA